MLSSGQEKRFIAYLSEQILLNKINKMPSIHQTVKIDEDFLLLIKKIIKTIISIHKPLFNKTFIDLIISLHTYRIMLNGINLV